MVSAQLPLRAQFFVFVFVHLCGHVHVCVGVCVCSYVWTRGQSWVSFLRHLLLYWFNLVWRLPRWLGWLASKFQESECLYFPTAGMIECTTSPGSFYMGPGVWTWVLMLKKQALCWLNHSLPPVSPSSWSCGGSSWDICFPCWSKDMSPPHLGHIWLLVNYSTGLSVWLSPGWWGPIMFQAVPPLTQLLMPAKSRCRQS